MSILEICQWIENTAPAALVRESAYGFQILVTAHLLGITLSVGTLLWFDLRLLGVALPRCGLEELYRALAPWFLGGFAVMFLSGAWLFAGYATAAYGNTFFRIKLVMLLLAGLNALLYHRQAARWSRALKLNARLPRSLRLSGSASIAFWAVVIFCGRMMSYTMF